MCQGIAQPYPPEVRRPPNGVADPRRLIELRIRPPVTAMQEWKNRIKMWRAAIGRLGIWSLALAVAGPVSLHLLDIFFFRSAERALNKAAWSYGPWFMDAVYAYISVMLSLCCWFCWAERDLSIDGSVDRKLDPAKLLGFYLGFIILNVAWEPIVFEFGAFKAGLLASVMKTWFAAAIARMFIHINLTAFLVECSYTKFWFADSHPMNYMVRIEEMETFRVVNPITTPSSGVELNGGDDDMTNSKNDKDGRLAKNHAMGVKAGYSFVSRSG
ncbi:hypothetical protein Vadar_008971 [Vaccinium darrowii]|uniref:Uncharacterized protein n=1 Tax=Vaccinium darrowii TaxID=229202 RepID=A0ACB7YCP5_9ERIC|nr:hypothetical protein Vadar_008971 [Vaccinium darrowii]